MPLLHLSLPPHRLLAGQRRLLALPTPTYPPSRLSVKLAAAAVHEACALPFPPDRASHHRELAAAVASVERACRLCVDVSSSTPTLSSGFDRPSEEIDCLD
jgi:3'(2'), 5'-bisphosphate nucleotidase